MDKKYSVFVSSTYTDLVAERKQVIDALNKLKSIPEVRRELDRMKR